MMVSTNFNEFKKALSNGPVEFKYTKVNGETRTARGTTANTMITEAGGNLPTGAGYAVSEDVTRYYDLNSKGWRSFKNENFIEYTAA